MFLTRLLRFVVFLFFKIRQLKSYESEEGWKDNLSNCEFCAFTQKKDIA